MITWFKTLLRMIKWFRNHERDYKYCRALLQHSDGNVTEVAIQEAKYFFQLPRLVVKEIKESDMPEELERQTFVLQYSNNGVALFKEAALKAKEQP